MKMPEVAPRWLEIINKNIGTLLEGKEGFFSLTEFVNKIDRKDEYPYWDTFKYKEMPEGASAELAWSFLKFTRQSKLIKTNLKSKDNQDFKYWLPDNVLRNLSFVDTYTRGDILISDDNIHKAEQKRYLVNSLMEEAIASSRLEGAATTRKKAKEMLQSGRKPVSHAEQMIYNNYKTILEIKDFVNRPLDEELILRLHQSITVGTLEDPAWCGRFRTISDEQIYVKDGDGQILYEPPPPQKIQEMMQLLYNYANEKDEEQFTHPVIKAINLHFYLSYVHPFNDGNGRTARALFYWYMLNKGYWMFEYLTISRIFIEAPAQYAKAFLYTEMDELDLTYFVTFHLKVIKRAVDELIEYIKNKQKELKDISYHLKKYPELNDRQKNLIKHALDNPEIQYTLVSHQNVHNITYESARRDLLYLVEKEFLIKMKRGRKFYFTLSDNIFKKIKGK